MRDATFLEKTIYTVCDATSSAELTVWGEHCLEVDQWYSMSNISVRQYNNKPYLTTTKDTEFRIINSQDTAVLLPTTSSHSQNCEIIGAQITNTYICPLKHPINMSLSSSKILCEKCKTQFKSTAIQMKTYGNLTMKYTSGKIFTAKIGNNIIGTIVDLKRSRSDDDIVDALLELPEMKVTTHNDFIIKIEPIDTNTITDDRAGPSTPFFQDTDLDQDILQIHTPPHSTHPTATDTSDYAIQDTQTDIETPSPPVQEPKHTNKKLRSVSMQLKTKK